MVVDVERVPDHTAVWNSRTQHLLNESHIALGNKTHALRGLVHRSDQFELFICRPPYFRDSLRDDDIRDSLRPTSLSPPQILRETAA